MSIGTPADQDAASVQRVLFVVHSYPPSTNVGVQRTLRFIRYLPAFGWRADVLAPGPIPDGGEALPPGVGEVTRAPEWLPLKAAVRTRNRLRTLLRGRAATPAAGTTTKPAAAGEAEDERPPEQSMAARLIDPWFSTPDEHIGWYRGATRAGRLILERRRPGAVYTSGPPHSAHLIAMRLRRQSGVPWVADFRDPWSRRPWLSSADKRGLRHAVQVRLEAAVVANADRVVLNTEAMTEDFRRHYPRVAHKFITITNGYDPEQAAAVGFGSQTAPSDVLTLLHAGSLYRRRDPRPLLDALAHAIAVHGIPAGRLRLDLLGHVDPAFGVAARVRTLGLEHVVRLLGRVSHAESLLSMQRSHVLVLLQPGTHLQVPAKVFEYMQMRRTILALTPEGATADIVREQELGVVVPAEDASAIADAIGLLWGRFSGGDSLQVDADRALRAFDGRVLTGRLAQVLTEVAKAI